jgi:hypothetical protein
MPERNDLPTVGEEEADFLDDDLDLDELDEAELPDAGPGEPELIDDDAADALLAEELDAVEAANGHADLELLEPAVDELPQHDAMPFDDADLGDDFGPALEEPALREDVGPTFEAPALPLPGPTVSAVPPDVEARLARLEAAARALAAAEVKRDSKRVRRKVSAATTGAGAIGAVPLLLQLAGAFDLDPEIVATASTVAAAIGAFIAGWVTPERKPALPPSVAHQTLTTGR